MGIMRGDKGFVGKLNSYIAITPYTAATTKPATKAAWETTVYGTAGVNTVQHVADVTGSLNNTNWYHYTPYATYCVWYNVASAGAIATIRANVATDAVTVHHYIEVALITNETANNAAIKTNTALARVLGTNTGMLDVTATVATDTVTLTNDYAGNGVTTASVDGTAGTTGFTIANSTPAVGVWTVFDETDETPIQTIEEGESFNNGLGNKKVVTNVASFAFNQINITAHQYNTLKTKYDNQQITVVYYDPNDNGGTGSIHGLDNVTCYVRKDLTGAHKIAIFEGGQTADRDTIDATEFYWDWSTIE